MNTKALAMGPEHSLLNELHDRSWRWHRDAASALLLAILAFAVRLNHVDFNSLSEDESAKWAAVQEYRHGHFVGVNSEHPMMLKVLAWGSLAAGERWNRLASLHCWPTMSPEGWLRFPNVLLGAATAAILFLFCRRLMGVVGSLAACFFWAVSPLAVALNRLAKEETPLTFFTLLACYFYCRAQQTDSDESARRWYDLSAIGFGLAFASQYILHLLGLNALAWLLAGRMELTRKPSRFSYGRFFLVIFLTFILVNPVVLCPSNFSAILHWLHHDGVTHSGYDFDGTLYLNFPSRLLAGVPWTFYLWLLLIKTPIPILVPAFAGSIMLLRDRRTLASCFFLVLGVLQLAGLSVSGAKWVRYSLPMLPFLFLAAGYAVQATWDRMKEMKMTLAFVGVATANLFALPLLELHAWSPYIAFYLNSIGGGQKNIARYFGQDEVSEFDTREVAQQVCSSAHVGARLATARPMSMTYYVNNCSRPDIQVVPLYDRHYVPRARDLIVLEPSRRFFETQKFFDALGRSGMWRREVRVGPVLASTIYTFESSTPEETGQEWTFTQLRKPPSEFEIKTVKSDLSGHEQCRRPPTIPLEKQIMIRSSQGVKGFAGRFLPTLALVAVCIPAVAQQVKVSAPLSADEVMRRVVQMNEQRANALQTYSSIRSYHLECHCLSNRKADMVVRVEYEAPNKKAFTILSESGSDTVRSRVFKKLLEAEQESMREENEQRSAISSGNYAFQLTDYQRVDGNEFYVLEAQPLTKNKFLFRGRIWVDAKDFAIVQVEGEPAVNPSWWTLKTDFKRSYRKIGSFWLPQSNESVTKVRIFGSAVLSINYRDYQITEIRNLNEPFHVEETSSNEQ